MTAGRELIPGSMGTPPGDPDPSGVDPFGTLGPAVPASDVVPVLMSSDVTTTLHQYRDIGFTARVEPGGVYGYLRLDAAKLHVSSVDPEGGPCRPTTCLIFTDEPDQLAQRMVAAGHGRVVMPEDRPWGLREGLYEDRDGNLLRFARRLPGSY